MKKVLLTVISIILLFYISVFLTKPKLEEVFYKLEYEKWEAFNIECEQKYKDLRILVDVPDSRLYLLDGDKLIKEYKCATGKPTTPSPIGVWKIVGKDNWGEGFGGYWMGFNVPWGKFGIHGTIYPNSIGWQSSKGCIRMNNKDVAELYKIVRVGTTVTIYGGPYGAFSYGLRNLKPGAIGSDVYEIQKLLKKKGYYNGYVDGKYGTSLKYAINKFQKDNKLLISDTLTIPFYRALGIYLFE